MGKKYIHKSEVQDYSIDLDFYPVRTKNSIKPDIVYFLPCAKGKNRGYVLFILVQFWYKMCAKFLHKIILV